MTGKATSTNNLGSIAQTRLDDIQSEHDFDIWCDASSLAVMTIHNLESLGLHHDENATVKLVIDIPQGSALYILESLNKLERATIRLVVATFNICTEYWEDLWDLDPDVLLVNPKHEHDYSDAITRASQGEQYRITPRCKTTLTHVERGVLRLLVRGWSNEHMATHLQIQEKTVMNTATRVIQKLGFTNRVEVAVYYWGVGNCLAEELLRS